MKKKVDERIRTLIDNGVRLRHRSMFVIIGDKYRDQIVNLHFILSKAVVKARPSVLWCYKDKLEISSNKRKRLKQTRALIKKGLLDVEKLDPFLLFAETGNLTYCKYENSDSILGNTYGMCILQDFEALTPNLLARTMETVEGGGLIIMVIHSLSSLTSLFTMVMDVHHRFRTESHYHATGRFNERFLLSLASCKACIVMDDELNILPVSSHVRSVTPISISKDLEGLSEAERDLKNLKESLQDEVIVGPLIQRCCTMDQGKALATFLNAVMDKTLHATIALTAARGRGKSAALGLAIAGAVATGFSNIYVTAPSPENLKTLFEFVCHGLDELGYKKPLHYDSVTNDKLYLKKSVVRINVYKQHRQTIQYLNPNDHQKLSQVELLVIDEAAAIPLPLVKAMLGPYLVFLSSTVNGYEGTGRSLSLKLLQQLDKESNMNADNSVGSHGHFERVELVESIRYASNDPIESWLNGLLCLDVASYIPCLSRLPPAEQCDLYYVNRDTLFSYHKDSEVFLQRMMALYVASHYKNSPNDLQLMADAPAHHLFVLLGPVDESQNHLPDILCVVQVCLEGQISKKSVMKSLSSGHHPFGDQIPWKFFEQFRDDVFPTLSGARIVRITVHPNAMGLKYGSRAVEMLTRYYKGEIAQFNEDEEEIQEAPSNIDEITEKVSLLEENIMPRSNLPPLLVHLRERRPEKLHYLGVSFGLTLELFRFWRKHCFVPFYICQIPNDVTGEHSCMMLKALENDDIEDSKDKDFGFVSPYYHDFKCRFVQLLSSSFRGMDYKLAMSILDPKLDYDEGESALEAQGALLSPHAMKRFEDYTNNLIDYHTILDIVPIISRQYFLEEIPVSLAYSHALVLFCMGLQHHDVTYIEKELDVERQQVISSLKKTMKKLYKHLNSHSTEINSTQPLRETAAEPHSVSLDELNEATKEVGKTMEIENGGPLYPEQLQRYTIVDRDTDFESALQNVRGDVTAGGVLSVKSSLKQKQKLGTNKEPGNFKKRGKELDRSHSNNKRKKKN